MMQDQLISEAHFMKGLLHPNLLPLYCSFIAGQDLWLVMPFIAGGTLANVLASRQVPCFRRFRQPAAHVPS